MNYLRDYGKASTIQIGLYDHTTEDLLTSPTISTGEFKISVDGSALTNLATTPTCSGGVVYVNLSAGELQGKNIAVRFISGTSQWKAGLLSIETVNSPFAQHPYIADMWSANTRTLTTQTALPVSTYDVPDTIPAALALIQGSSKIYKVTIPDVPGGQSINQAYFAIKTSNSDPDSSALVFKTITTTASSVGQITNDGSATGVAVLEFWLTPTDVDSLPTDVLLYSSVKVLLASGSVCAVADAFRDVSIQAPGIVRES